MSNLYYEKMNIAKNRMRTLRIGFIGAGKVGTALAFHCVRLGYEIAGIYDINPERTQKLANLLKIDRLSILKSIEEVTKDSNVLFLIVPDKNIKPVFMRVKNEIAPGTILVHCAGVFGIEVFSVKGRQKFESLAMHPLQTFLSPKQAIAVLPKSYFALDGTKKGLQFGKRFIRQLKGKAILVTDKDRPLYHAMCVFASNFINGLMEAAEEIGKKLGFSRRQTIAMLMPLIKSTLNNIRDRGAVASLTGPVKRGDRKTVARHIQALKANIPEIVPVYRALTRRLEAVVEQKNKRSSG